MTAEHGPSDAASTVPRFLRLTTTQIYQDTKLLYQRIAERYGEPELTLEEWTEACANPLARASPSENEGKRYFYEVDMLATQLKGSSGQPILYSRCTDYRKAHQLFSQSTGKQFGMMKIVLELVEEKVAALMQAGIVQDSYPFTLFCNTLNTGVSCLKKELQNERGLASGAKKEMQALHANLLHIIQDSIALTGRLPKSDAVKNFTSLQDFEENYNALIGHLGNFREALENSEQLPKTIRDHLNEHFRVIAVSKAKLETSRAAAPQNFGRGTGRE